MGIKAIHDHPGGKVCYTTRTNHPLEHQGLFREIDPVTFRPTVFAAAYMPYTGHWYAWNPETGEEIATFSRAFFEGVIAHMRIASLVEDPDCVT